jgi:hypothetical protein
MNRSSQGNILFLILIAVALFAALSYAVTGSSRNSGEAITKDKAKLAAAALIQYSSEVEQALTRMTLANGISWAAVSYGGNNSACSGNSCKLFHPEGGNARLLPPALAMAEGFENTTAQVRFENIKDVGSDLPDLVLIVYAVNLEVCRAINDILRLPSDPIIYNNTSNVVGGSGTHQLNAGNYSPDKLHAVTMSAPQGFYILNIGVNAGDGAAAGQRSYCHCQNNAQCTVGGNLWGRAYKHVLVAR